MRPPLILNQIQTEPDPNRKHLLLAGILSSLFRRMRFDLVVVGGSAVEFYTDGQYMSGDLDLCWKHWRPAQSELDKVMRELGAKGGPRSWKICGALVDLLGVVENDSKANFRVLRDAPAGSVSLIPIEHLLVERVLMSVYPQSNQEARDCAAKLLAVCLDKKSPFKVDWKEVHRLAASPAYKVNAELEVLKTQVETKLKSKRV